MTTESARPAGAGPRRVPLTEGCRQVSTLAARNLMHIRRNPDELIDLSVVPVMLLLLFTYVFGGAIADSTSEYLQFVLPGVIVMSAMLGTLSTGMGLNVDVMKGYLDRLRSLPVARSAPLAGRILADTAKQAWSMALLLGIGAVLGFRVQTDAASVLGALLLLCVFSFALSWLAVLFGVIAADPEKVQNLGFAVVFPMAFTSGAFVPKDTMPGWLDWWVNVNPAGQLVDAVRGLLIGGPVAAPAFRVVLFTVLCTAVLLPVAVNAVKRKV
ncbi:ABC transporter permease [Streptomyces boncukensis]|uniref:Transport permease protein n=1 Tax=Streptomyces boncukensis TaxID=2711219 RepID=A0A6G4WYN1_9ACTN|nr:ABC transporter permease [Streptomyces boncukensis]NGO70345.1 ABC transporter permease [Streptomyces boncukensis]